MAEYIEREATVELLRSLGSRDYRREKGTIQDAIKMISFPEYTPAADVAPVVRCCECSFCDNTMRCQCDNSCKGLIREDDDFCSYGERRAT